MFKIGKQNNGCVLEGRRGKQVQTVELQTQLHYRELLSSSC